MAETESQQIALLANASLLADDLLPRAAMKLAPINQSNCNDDPRRRPADRQNRHPGQREWKRHLDGDSHLSADMYINMDGNADEMEWLPSPIFQDLYTKLNRVASIASEMFVDIEEGPRPLGPLGLQQFYLDMKFVVCFASQGRYLSRNLHQVVNDIISKAMAAFSGTGMDPNSVLPEDDWFTDVCQDAMERLSG
ncbi:hypothetical protein RHSIM_RhsimUnG0234400 [Rhododendron simsii]|uniref:Uncharacterized protein n=1 Tax=Rhododendron simsii TaxID=118357 RepID=A0A834FT61_RHOSS|nr:hypothetical protein RHSIM_RhsimUnG0234400 [Rhododendron simsii]